VVITCQSLVGAFMRKLFIFVILFIFPIVSFADDEDIFDMPLDKLLNIEVTSVSKKAEKASEAAASIYVVTSEDIRRTGVTSIPEALRMVPGLSVAQLNSHKWAVGARGFNEEYTNKLLVLIDGRTVFNPLFSGVNWDVQDVVLEDIDRIEVIKGPGASLWGANAVNGVINIITKKAQDTKGLYVSTSVGTYDKIITEARYGGNVGDNVHYRFYTKYLDRGSTQRTSGESSLDEWDMGRSGFRVDVDNFLNRENNNFTVQGDVYLGLESSNVESTIPMASNIGDDEIFGGNILTRWKHPASEKVDITVQSYYDRNERHSTIGGEIRNTFDIEVQSVVKMSEQNTFIVGGGYRFIEDTVSNGTLLTILPLSREDHLYSLFFQDTYELIPDTLSITAGTKLELNDYTGVEYQPNVRMAWTPSKRSTFWGAISRAVQVPSRVDEDGTFAAANLGATELRVVPNKDVDSEKLYAYELGYKSQVNDDLYFDISTFYHDYEDLRAGEVVSSFFDGGTLIIPTKNYNTGYGESYGFEVSADWDVKKNWRLEAGYSFVETHFHIDRGHTSSTFEVKEGDTAKNRFNIRSYWNITPKIELDNSLYFVGNVTNNGIEPYVRFDTRLGWKPTKNIEASIVGQNLFDNKHPEKAVFIGATVNEIPRSVYGKLTFRF